MVCRRVNGFGQTNCGDEGAGVQYEQQLSSPCWLGSGSGTLREAAPILAILGALCLARAPAPSTSWSQNPPMFDVWGGGAGGFGPKGPREDQAKAYELLLEDHVEFIAQEILAGRVEAPLTQGEIDEPGPALLPITGWTSRTG